MLAKCWTIVDIERLPSSPSIQMYDIQMLDNGRDAAGEGEPGPILVRPDRNE